MIRQKWTWQVGLLCLGLIAGCATAPDQTPSQQPQPSTETPTGEVADNPAPTELPEQNLLLRAADSGEFTVQLPGWQETSIAAARDAFRKSCARWRNRAADDQLSSNAPYAGRIADWLPVCASLEAVTDETEARLIIDALMTPLEVNAYNGESRFTGYFEPEIETRRVPVWPYIQPIPGVPSDLEQVDASVFGWNGGRVPAQRLPDGSLRPYPPREEIAVETDKVLGYAHPADVFFMQIQGSGRLRFDDGAVLRAAYGAHNGQPFRSTANWLMETGRITRGEASMQGIRAWMDRAGLEESRLAMDQNPRFVFFQPVEIGDPAAGPVGAFNVPLTALGSMAVDTSLHPLGVPMFVETTAPGLGGDWRGLLIAQDTGGAINGPVRGDIYYGTGAEAGARAGTTNAPGRLWVLLPKPVAEQVLSGES